MRKLAGKKQSSALAQLTKQKTLAIFDDKEKHIKPISLTRFRKI
jgi:hypothetical protein